MFIQAITVQSSVLCLAMASSTSSSIVVRRGVPIHSLSCKHHSLRLSHPPFLCVRSCSRGFFRWTLLEFMTYGQCRNLNLAYACI